MKNLHLFIALSFALWSCSGNSGNDMEIGQFTTIEVQKTFDAGTVAKGEIVKTKIEIKNTGRYPLIIADIKPSCSCTVSEFDQDPIPPGESTVVTADIDTQKTGMGKIRKPITITANTHPSTTEVMIIADVID